MLTGDTTEHEADMLALAGHLDGLCGLRRAKGISAVPSSAWGFR